MATVLENRVSKFGMGARCRGAMCAALIGLLGLGISTASAQVVVSILGNQALAHISLGSGPITYVANVTITFDAPVNLTATELNLTASLVNPTDPTLLARLSSCAPSCTIDPAFPMMVTVEPPSLPQLFHSGFEQNELENGNLGFSNAYEFELHTANIDCTGAPSGPCPTTQYRLFKAPVGGDFKDITSSVLKGSVRARGRGGEFSQFLIVEDTGASITVEPVKSMNLQTRIQGASIPAALQNNLLAQLASVQVSFGTANYSMAISTLDQLIASVQANAGVVIANAWSSDHTLVNDAGEILAFAQTLRYTLDRLQNGN